MAATWGSAVRDPAEPTEQHRSAPPGWAVELIDVLTLRWSLTVGVALAVSAVGVLVAFAFPGVLPPHALVGAAVGIAAVLLAVAAAVAADASDRVVRGTRHVRAAGATVAGLVDENDHASLSDLLVDRQRRRPGGREGDRKDEAGGDPEEGADRLRLGVTTANPGVLDTAAAADALATALARQGRAVLAVDLHSTTGALAGAAEVCRGEAKLADVVTFHEGHRLARLGPGRGLVTALNDLPLLLARLPVDVDDVVIALPDIRHPGSLTAASAIGRCVLAVGIDRTTRVDLLTALDALDEAGVATDVLLVREDATGEPADDLPWAPPNPQGGSGEDPPTGRDLRALPDLPDLPDLHDRASALAVDEERFAGEDTFPATAEPPASPRVSGPASGPPTEPSAEHLPDRARPGELSGRGGRAESPAGSQTPWDAEPPEDRWRDPPAPRRVADAAPAATLGPGDVFGGPQPEPARPAADLPPAGWPWRSTEPASSKALRGAVTVERLTSEIWHRDERYADQDDQPPDRAG